MVFEFVEKIFINLSHVGLSPRDLVCDTQHYLDTQHEVNQCGH